MQTQLGSNNSQNSLPLTQARELLSLEAIDNAQLNAQTQSITTEILTRLQTAGEFFAEAPTKKLIAHLLTLSDEEFNTITDSKLSIFLTHNYNQVFNYLLTAYPGKRMSPLDIISNLLELVRKEREKLKQTETLQ